jgi:hypothetical protein
MMITTVMDKMCRRRKISRHPGPDSAKSNVLNRDSGHESRNSFIFLYIINAEL